MLGDATRKAEAKYSINITKSKNKICSSLHDNGSKNFFMLME